MSNQSTDLKASFALALAEALVATSVTIPVAVAVYIARNFIERFAGLEGLDLSESMARINLHDMMSRTQAQAKFLRYLKAELPKIHERLRRMRAQKLASLTISSVIIPDRKTYEGTLVRSTAALWTEIIELLQNDWSLAFKIPPERWEEIVAGAYQRSGFDEVTLTPRSGDLGRDVIAIKHGVGTVRILGSVKAYKPDHLVTRAHVHEMMGVVGADPRASKGIISTTSDFAPRLFDDDNLERIVPYRIELMNGPALQKWLSGLIGRS